MSTVRHCLLLLIGLALGCVWLASAAGNFAHGTQLAGASPYWWVYGLASASADVLKATALLALTPAYRARWGFFSKAWAIVALLLIFTLTLGWGVRSCAGFISTTLSDTVSTRAMHGVADKSLGKQIDDQVNQVTKLQDLKMRSPSRDWERIEGEIGRVEARLDALRNKARHESSAGAADPVGELLQTWVDPKTTRLGTVVLLLLMVEAVASLGLMAFAPLLGIDYNKIADMLAGNKPPQIAQPRTPSPRKGGGPTPKREPKPKGERKRDRSVPPSDLRMQALELLGNLETKYGVGNTASMEDVFLFYLDLAGKHRWAKPMDRTKLGKQLFHVGVEKTDPDDRGRIYYQLPTAADKARLKAKGVGEDGLPLA